MDKPDANNQTPAPQSTIVPVTPPSAPQPPAPHAMAASPTISTQPNKNANVPKYETCMASDPTASERLLKAIESEEAKQD